LSDASRQFAAGAHAYTSSQDGRLQFLAWVTDAPDEVLGDEIAKANGFPQSTALISNVSVFDPNFVPNFDFALRHVMRDAACNSEAETIVVAVPDRDQKLRRAVKALGCVCIGKIETAVRFGRARTKFEIIPLPVAPRARRSDLVSSAVSAVMSASPCLLAV
jgi:hypothetical protein